MQENQSKVVYGPYEELIKLILLFWFNVVDAPKQVTSFLLLRELYQKKFQWKRNHCIKKQK